MKALLSALLVATALFVGYTQVDGNETQRALFIGNSHTFENDLPGMVANVMGANGVDLEVELIATGGRTLAQHVGDPNVRTSITTGDFDLVILQEQSEFPAISQRLSNESYPAAEQLGEWASDAGVRVILFETWGHRNGSTFSGHDTFEGMQVAVSRGYWALAEASGGTVAPAGSTWARSLAANDIVLHAADGYHPAPAGTHLASLVIARTILGEPLTSFPDNGIADDEAEQLAGLLW